MRSETTTAREITIAYLTANPQVATQTAAKHLLKQHPKLWPSLNAARDCVRRVRGAHGKHCREHMIRVKHCERTKAEAERCRTWGAMIPEPSQNTWGWKTLPPGIGKWLILCDLHMPYHDKIALKAALTHGEGCDGVILNGDNVDSYTLSRFEKDPEARNYDKEIEDFGCFLDALQVWGAKKIIMKLGNHEARLERYLLARCPELWQGKVREKIGWRAFLDLDQRGITLIDSMDPISVGKLTILHGHEFGSGATSPVNPARSAYLKGRECCLVGHQHRASEHTEVTMLGTTITTWSTGCLCDLHPRYRPINAWGHGAAILDLTGEDWRIQNFRIVEGRVV